jgi:hypothetical protein
MLISWRWLLHPPIGVALIVGLIFLIAGLSSEKPAQRSGSPQATIEPIVSDWYRPDCNQPKDREDADLCEQRRMAQAAEDSLFLSTIQIFLGIAGSGLLLWTLFYNRIAAKAAADAAKAAAESADALMDAERPHMIATDLAIVGAAQPPDDKGMVTLQLTFRFVNCGRSPATLTGFVLLFVIDDKLAQNPNYENPVLLRFMIAPNGQYGSTAPSFLRADANDVAKLHMGQYEIWLYGKLEYDDQFERHHKYRFAYLMRIEGDVSTMMKPDGPDSYHEYT